jgi:hypothetical protein
MEQPTHKIVNGIAIALTPDEVTATVAEWEANENTPQIVFADKVAAGYDTGQGWFLPIDDASRASLGELRMQIREGLELGAWTADAACPVQILAMNGSLQALTIGQVRELIFQAGNYYAQLVAELQLARAALAG